jgi:hypothetical protein
MTVDTKRPILTVYGDGINDDSDALQAFLDGQADLIHADGTPYTWPGTAGRKYHIARTLVLGGKNRDMSIVRNSLPRTAWIGVDV